MKIALLLEDGDRTVADHASLRIENEAGGEKFTIVFRPKDLSALEQLCWNLNLAGGCPPSAPWK